MFENKKTGKVLKLKQCSVVSERVTVVSVKMEKRHSVVD